MIEPFRRGAVAGLETGHSRPSPLPPIAALALGILALLLGSACERPEAPPALASVRSPESGELEMKAFAAAWPERIEALAKRDGNWCVRIDGFWFAWAHGRLLPEAEKADWERWTRISFYTYPRGLPPVPELDGERTAGVARRSRAQEEYPPNRSEAFFARLYEADSQAEMDAQVVRLDFLGKGLRVHRTIAGRMEAVERSLLELSAQDPAIRRFLAGIRYPSGYLWRDIAGTVSRSYHAYGLAVDLVPRSYGGKEFYWRNLQPFGDDWYALPYAERWMVPLSVVDAFEAEGFIWGGKWFSFDNVHFEYRPELFLYRELKERADG